MPTLIQETDLTAKMKRDSFVTFIAGEASVIIGAALELYVLMSNAAIEKMALALAPVVLGTIAIVFGRAKMRRAAKMEQTVIS